MNSSIATGRAVNSPNSGPENPNINNNNNQIEGEPTNHNKRGSIFSLFAVHTNSLYQYRTMTLLQSQGEQTDPIRVNSEVTLGADKRRKLFTSEDLDLKTLNQKHSLKSYDSQDVKRSDSISQQHELDQYDKDEDDIKENDGSEQQIRTSKQIKNIYNSFHSVESKNNNNNNNNAGLLLYGGTGSSHLLEFKDEQQSLGRLDHMDGTMNDTSGSRRSNNFINGLDKTGIINQIPSTGRLTQLQKDLLINQYVTQTPTKTHSQHQSPIENTSLQDLENYPMQQYINSKKQASTSSATLLQDHHQSQHHHQMSSNQKEHKTPHQPSEQEASSDQPQLHPHSLVFPKHMQSPSMKGNLLAQSKTHAGFIRTNSISNSPAQLGLSPGEENNAILDKVNGTTLKNEQQQLQPSKTQQQQEAQNTGFNFKSLANLITTSQVKHKLMGLLGIEKFKRIGQVHLNLINDVAVDQINAIQLKVSNVKINNNNNTTNPKKQSSEEKQLEQHLQYRNVLDDYMGSSHVWLPDNLVLTAWEIFVMIIQIFLLIIQPIKRSFVSSVLDENLFVFVFENFFAPILLGINVLVTMNKGYYDEGMVITSRQKILQRYARMLLWLDILNIIICYVYDDLSIVIIFLISLFRLVQSNRSWQQIDEYLEVSHRFATLTQIVELFFLIFLIAHLCACGFFYISKSDFDHGVTPTWIENQKIQFLDWDQQYIYAIYFEFITMTTIGYGDIFPCSQNERVYVIFMTLVSCAVFGYSLNAIGQIFRDLSMQLSSFKQTKYDISKYLKNRNITKRVQFKIYKYLEYLNRQENEGHFFMKGEKILSRVSSSLKEEVQKEYFGKILNQIPFFTKNFSTAFLSELALHVNELNLAPGEFLFKTGSPDASLFFLSKGIVEFFVTIPAKNDKTTEKILQQVTGGNLIGHTEFVSDQTRTYTARSLCISHFVFIRKHDFLNLFERFPLDYETFCMLKDDIILKGQDRFAVCESCKRTGHSVLKCDMIFKQFNKFSVIKRANYSQFQERASRIRQITHKLRFQRESVASNLKRFRQNFIAKAIRINNSKQTKQTQQFDEFDSDCSELPNAYPLESSHHLNQASVRQTGGSVNADSMTFKSYSRPAMTTEFGGEEDRIFYKKYPKIHFEDDKYLILSSSSHSSSEAEEEDEYDDEYEYDIRQGYDPRQGFDFIDERDRRYPNNNDPLMTRQPYQKRSSDRRHPTAHSHTPLIALSPNSKPTSMTSIMNVEMPAIQLEPTAPYQISRPISSQQSSSYSSLPVSNISALNQYQHSTSIGVQPSSPSLPPTSATMLPAINTNAVNPALSTNINQLITSLSNRNYFDSNDFLDDNNNSNAYNNTLNNNSNNNNNNTLNLNGQTEMRKLTLFLPPVEEASEISEQSQEMMTSFTNQLSSSPLIRKSHRELSKRQSSRKFSSASIPRSESMQMSKDDLVRRKSGRHDTLNTLNTQRIVRDGRKVSYVVDSQLYTREFSRGDPSSGLNSLSQRSITLQNTLSKSHSRSSKLMPAFDRSRSRVSQSTILQQNLQLFLVQFDRMKEYKFYYPHNNASMILKIRTKSLKKKKILKRRKTNQIYSTNNLMKSVHAITAATAIAGAANKPVPPTHFHTMLSKTLPTTHQH